MFSDFSETSTPLESKAIRTISSSGSKSSAGRRRAQPQTLKIKILAKYSKRWISEQGERTLSITLGVSLREFGYAPLKVWIERVKGQSLPIVREGHLIIAPQFVKLGKEFILVVMLGVQPHRLLEFVLGPLPVAALKGELGLLLV